MNGADHNWHVNRWFFVHVNAARARRSLAPVEFRDACKSRILFAGNPIEAAEFSRQLETGDMSRLWAA